MRKYAKIQKNSKARYECGLVYELFKTPYAGKDIYQSLTKLFNNIKEEQVIPDFFDFMSITSLYKSRGVRSDLSNERCIFNVAKVRSIFDKIIYADDTIDQQMIFSYVGGRKH